VNGIYDFKMKDGKIWIEIRQPRLTIYNKLRIKTLQISQPHYD